MGLARMAFMAKDFNRAAELYDAIAHEPVGSHSAEAKYWAAVSKYKAGHDAAPLTEVAGRLQAEHPGSAWTTRASVWLPVKTESGASLR